MYPCTECDKEYASQNSLTRHIHNHRKTKKHVCSSCGIVFYRRDLLSRHSKLHKLPPPEQLRSAGSQSDVDHGRKRCHTACLRCREQRTKCNSQQPCTACVKAGAHCEYSRRSNRLSHLRSESRSTSSAQFESVAGHRQHRPEPACASTAHQLIDQQHDAQMDYPSASHLDSIQQQAFPSFSDPMAQNVAVEDMSTSMATPMLDVVSWPWLHENLFLPSPLNPISNQLDPLGLQYFADNPHPGSMASTMLQRYPGEVQPDQGPLSDVLVTQSSPVAVLDTNRHEDHNQNPIQSRPIQRVDQPEGTDGASLNPSQRANYPRPGHSRNAQARVIHDLVTFASSHDFGSEPKANRTAFWAMMSTKVADVFHIFPGDGHEKSSSLHRFFELYLLHFGPLWPLLSLQTLDVDALHPLLFLVLTSIGAMYGGTSASEYGAMMHAQIRSSLTEAIELDDNETDFLWLAQARLLTQVAALYFGQTKAFSYAQHLGALLVAQARRMNLFSAAYAANFMGKFRRLKGVASDRERLAVWLQLEARRRLAFGIFRGDTYTSVLLHTKPLVSLEEIDLEFPMCDTVWRGEPMPPSLCLHMIEHDQTPGRQMRASDLYRIAMDQNEPLPPLDPCGQELLMFGLQYPIWRFSRDQTMFERLTGREGECLGQEIPIGRSGSHSDSATGRNPGSNGRPLGLEAHHLDSTSRLMVDLVSDSHRLMSTLEKWERALPLVKTFVRTDMDRTSLLSSLILFHLGHLCLCAPLEDLHQIQYRMADNRAIDRNLIISVRQWADTHRGRLAAERACRIWSLIARESQMVKDTRARFNLLAFTGLHHAAVLLWAYAGAHNFANDKVSDGYLFAVEARDPRQPAILVNPQESPRFLRSFVELYDCISPARWSSFAKAANTLASQQFPTD